jgi:hypothetical protein
MKKIIIVTAFILTAGTLLSQNLKKGSYMGIQDLAVTLSAGVTWKQYLEFTMENFIPEAEMAFPGMSVFVMRGGMEAGNSEETEEMYSLIYFLNQKRCSGNTSIMRVISMMQVQLQWNYWNPYLRCMRNWGQTAHL